MSDHSRPTEGQWQSDPRARGAVQQSSGAMDPRRVPQSNGMPQPAPAARSHNAPAGVNMPKKKDPRLRVVQEPPKQQFFDSADYEITRQQQEQQQIQQQRAYGYRKNPPPPPPGMAGAGNDGVSSGGYAPGARPNRGNPPPPLPPSSY